MICNYRKILVTGGAGFIGSHIVDRLLNEGFEVTVIDNLDTGRLENFAKHQSRKEFHFIKGDIRDFNLVKKSMKGIDVVFHEAALASVTLSVENPITVIMDANHTLKAVFVDDISPEISVPAQEPPENVTAYQNVTVTVNVTEAGSGLYNITLWYSTNNGTTWTPLNMTEISTSIYQTTIPGHENCTWVTYRIIAYDSIGNQAINDNHGYLHLPRHTRIPTVGTNTALIPNTNIHHS